MPNSNLNHRRTHNLLLISKLLYQRDHVSPMTLVLDSLEQPAQPLLREYLRRAELSSSKTIFLSFETPRPLRNVSYFVRCWDKTPSQVRQEVTQILSASKNGTTSQRKITSALRCEAGKLLSSALPDKRLAGHVLLIDTLQPLALHASQDLTFNVSAYLSSFVLPEPGCPMRQLSLVAVYHTQFPELNSKNTFAPSILSELMYLATSVIRLHSLSHLVAEKAAQDRSLPRPVFGLAEEVDGVVVGLSKNHTAKNILRGVILELEHRRKTGRAVVEWFFLPAMAPDSRSIKDAMREQITLLDDHQLLARNVDLTDPSGEEPSGVTFDLHLTERQRQEREGVVLPYFDAQHAGGVGEGGRILYNLGAEDDFDDEEDED